MKLREIKEWFKAIALVGLVGLAVLLFALISGCGLTSVFGPGAYSEMSPAQIEQFQKMALDVYARSTLAGPPPSGRVVDIVVPRLDKKPDVRFGSDCQIR